MNLQFSVSAGVSGGSIQAGQTSSASSKADSQLIQSARSGGELSKLTNQGVAVPIGDEQLMKAIDRAVKALQGPETTLEINIHEKTHQLMVKVLNKENGEVIREIPPEKTLDLVAKMMEIAGILVDKRV
ncbi:flagellar protein FlaG [Saccharibacillus sp. CPCC 101409]|uniref:flagellar protein FlaG n=1 Tax=Saccharibacillus sp. CPCC 101409 TaxID=3058041 RepID=UPI002672C053|nr:flagellar protein FlaG [Saccharibacillus sp. CPCC 101409]MDO3412075.1 flagellar protein FlaG [Saccharibacillus sp. CPCC 101409]